MVSAKYHINWMLDRRGEYARLRMAVRWDGKRVTFMLGMNIDADKWVQDASRVKPNTTHGKDHVSAQVVNKRIARYEEIVDELLSSDNQMTEDEFRNAFNQSLGKTAQKPENTLVSILETFVHEKGLQNSWSEASYKKYNTIGVHLAQYNDKLTPEDMTPHVMNDFMQYLIGKGYRNSYVAKLIKCVKEFLKWLAENDMYHGTAYKVFSPRLRGDSVNKNAIVYLTWDELLALYEMKGLPTYLEQVRDVFCFCSFTSLRYSDVEKLQRSDISDDCILVVTKKTTDALKIELNDRSRAILDKYKDVQFPKGKALPVISNQKMNDYLKELGKRAGLDKPIRIVYYNGAERHEEVHPKWELLTTHAARRTFVVNALYLGIPAEVIIRWTGHSDYKSMKPYVAIVDDLKENEMKKFNR